MKGIKISMITGAWPERKASVYAKYGNLEAPMGPRKTPWWVRSQGAKPPEAHLCFVKRIPKIII